MRFTGILCALDRPNLLPGGPLRETRRSMAQGCRARDVFLSEKISDDLGWGSVGRKKRRDRGDPGIDQDEPRQTANRKWSRAVDTVAILVPEMLSLAAVQ